MKLDEAAHIAAKKNRLCEAASIILRAAPPVPHPHPAPAGPLKAMYADRD